MKALTRCKVCMRIHEPHCALTPEAAKPVNTRAKDRHKPGYMAEYMRKRRAKK